MDKELTMPRVEMLDITAPELVEISIRHDGKVVWVNVDGACAFRACRIKELVVEDAREPRRKDNGNIE